MNKSGGGLDLGLSLTGLRIGPRDPATHAPKVGVRNEVVRPEHSLASLQPRILKERVAFSGGFKIPEDFRKTKLTKKGLGIDHDQEEDLEGTQQSQITKDEIFQQLALGNSEAGIGIGRHGTNSKSALAKDLVEGIEKDLEKLRRQQENLQLRKTLALNGGQSIIEETQEEKDQEQKAKLKTDLELAGTYVIDASPKKFQVMRHQASQLASVKNLDIEELEMMRTENDKRLKELEEVYMRKRENSQVGRIMREKMGFPSSGVGSRGESAIGGTPRRKEGHDEGFDRDDNHDDEEDKLTKSQRKKKSVRIVEGEKENHFDSSNAKDKQLNSAAFAKYASNRGRQSALPPTSSVVTKNIGAQSAVTANQRSKSRLRSESPLLEYADPRTKLYEAKFEKYLANKDQKFKQDRKLEKMQKEDFDRYTKGPESPAKSSKRFAQRSNSKTSYDPATLIPKDYDETLLVKKQLEEEKKLQMLKKDKFKSLGVSNEDKMTFYLLKWIFNAIKRESSDEDPKLKGRSYVTKIDLIRQLGKNDELMRALGYHDQEEVTQAIKVCGGAKEGCLVWEEFLDFFFLRQSSLQRRIESNQGNWWRQIGNSDIKNPQLQTETEEDQSPSKQQSQQQLTGVPRYGSTKPQDVALPSFMKQEDPDKKPVKMTESLKILQDTRKQKTAYEVEEEFKLLQDRKAQEKLAAQQSQQQKHHSKKQQQSQNSFKKGAPMYEYDENADDEDQQLEELGIKREKSQCLLLQSQIFIMQEIFEAMDRYKDKILRRAEYLMALRTDERVVEFIDADAVKVPYSNRVLTLDQMFSEIEKDEVYELSQIGKNSMIGQINHKEFITWREFMGYFNDYKDVEERNKKAKEIQRTRQNLQKERQQNVGSDGSDHGIEIMSLMEKEKQRRLQELPKLRPPDQIDISEKQLQLLKDIYDQLPRANTGNNKDMINTIDFFIATRKNPQLRAIASAIARDPEGYSRIPKETFQQVFDRMENEIQAKQIEWATLVEYFTKRGRPLSKDEINKLIQEDKQQREEEENRKRNEEEAERRRLARLMEDLEEKEDFEEFEIRQKSEEAAKILQEKRFERDLDNDGEEDNEAEEYGGRRGGRSRGGNHRFLDESQERDDDEDEYYDEDNIDRDDEDMDIPGGYTSDPELRTAKRDYKFGGERGYSEKRLRAHSAKGERRPNFDEKNIRSTKLTTQDYINNDRSLSRKAKGGKYGLTVPKPFDFDVRDKTKKKTIRERKVDEMIAQKKLEEEAIIKYQIRPNPIPPEVLIPRYKTIMESNEMRRMEVKKNSLAIMKSREAPFSFYEREKGKTKPDPEDYLPYNVKKPHFKANPIPRACSVLIFDQMMKRQEEERQERIRKQAELNFSKAKLPDRMQMHQEKMKQESQNQSRKTLQEQLGCSFRPKINGLVTKEQFEKAQQKFNQKLNKKKSQMQVTRPKSPNFTKTSSKTLDRQYLNEQQYQAPVDKFKAALQKSLAKQASQGGDKAVENPSSTNSMNLAMQHRREELEAKRKAEEAKKKEDQDRFERQNRMKNTVQAALKDRINDDKEKIEEKKRKQKQEARDAKKEVEEKARQREEKVRGMPLLVQRLYGGKNNSNLAKIKATQMFIDVLKEQGVDPKNHLTDEQKELMAEQDYIEKRKRELGKI